MLFIRPWIRANKYRYTGFAHGVLHLPREQPRRRTNADGAAAFSWLSQRRAVLVDDSALLAGLVGRGAQSAFDIFISSIDIIFAARRS